MSFYPLSSQDGIRPLSILTFEIELPDFNHPVFDKQTLLKDTGYQGYNPEGIKSL
jgi:hypothetical protein